MTISSITPIRMHSQTLYLIRKADELSSNVSHVSNLTIDNSLKNEVVAQTDEYLDAAGEIKEMVKKDSSLQKPANRILSLELAVDCWKHEILMWESLQDGEWDKAWNFLTTAQLRASQSLQADKLGELCGMDQYRKRLLFIENVIFPDQTFFSPGIKIGSAECSICKRDYAECKHIKGYPYNGELCYTEITEISEIDHVSVVDNPANKRARIMLAGGRDTMTGLPSSGFSVEAEEEN